MKSCIGLFLLFFLTDESFSQDTRPLMDKLAARINAHGKTTTSVYLRTSKDIYAAGEDLWFTAFVLDAQTFALSALDKTLYLQLQQQKNDSIAWQEMYAINNGLSSGQVFLPQMLPEGEYLLKAYTAHSFFYNQPYFYAVSRIRVVKELRSIVQDKISNTEKKEIQFGVFPEGGNLVSGLPGRMAFKAVGKNGKPVDVKGTLLKGSSPILTFKSSHAGMGSFEFKPEINTEYHIKIDNSDSLYNIPKIHVNGIVMQLIKNDDSLVFKITGSTSEKKRVFLRLQVRGVVQSVASGVLTDSLEIKIPTKNVPQGVAEVTLFDEALQPLCERLVFLHPEKRLNIAVDSIKEQYHPKEKVSFKIKTSANGKPVPTVLNICVYDKLFNDRENARDIVNYYYLSTQLRGNIYDPSYYFDNSHKDRLAALDLLLLTQGWRRYVWNEEIQKENQRAVLADSIQALVTGVVKGGKEKSISLMMYNYNKSIQQITVTDADGKFYLTPNSFALGPRFFVKYFSKNTHSIVVSDPFKLLVSPGIKPPIDIRERRETATNKENKFFPDSYLKYGVVLQEVTISGKGRGLTDKYFGYLDSIAKFEENNFDYVGACNWLNCPACGSGTKPVEGVTYSELAEPRRSQVSGHPFSFTTNDYKKVTYHYPKYTEEDLLKKFKMAIVKGYFKSKEFYEPDYDKIDKSESDMRNTLLWKQIVTDKNGEAVLSFFCSDISSQFMGIVEGVGDEGLLGVSRFSFSVK